MSPRDGHVITVSGGLILTAANSSSYGWLTKCQFLQHVTVDISLHEVCVRVGVLYVITKFSRMDGLPNFLTHGAPQARASRARELRYYEILRVIVTNSSFLPLICKSYLIRRFIFGPKFYSGKSPKSCMN